MNLNKETEISMEEAIKSWFFNVYFPLVSIIREKYILRNFPGRTLADLYVWTVRYWDDLKKKFGDDIPMDEAVNGFTKHYKIPLAKRILNRFKCVILRKAITNANPDSPEQF